MADRIHFKGDLRCMPDPAQVIKLIETFRCAQMSLPDSKFPFKYLSGSCKTSLRKTDRIDRAVGAPTRMQFFHPASIPQKFLDPSRLASAYSQRIHQDILCHLPKLSRYAGRGKRSHDCRAVIPCIMELSSCRQRQPYDDLPDVYKRQYIHSGPAGHALFAGAETRHRKLPRQTPYQVSPAGPPGWNRRRRTPHRSPPKVPWQWLASCQRSPGLKPRS